MKNFIKSALKKLVRTTEGKVLLSILLLICVLATKGLYDNNMQVVQAVTQKHLVKSNISTTNTKNIKHVEESKQDTIKSNHIDRTRHIIVTLPATKQNQHVEFMNCTSVVYNKTTKEYILNLQDQNSKIYNYTLHKSNFNKYVLQNLHGLFYNQIAIITIDNNSNSIKSLQLLNETFTGEQLSNDAVADEINTIVSKHNIK